MMVPSSINIDAIREGFMVMDDDGYFFAYSSLDEQILSEARIVIQVIVDEDSGFTTSRIIKNRVGGTG